METLKIINERISTIEKELYRLQSDRSNISENECKRLCSVLHDMLGPYPEDMAKDFDFKVCYYERRGQFRVHVIVKKDWNRTIELVPEFTSTGEIDAFNMMLSSGDPYWFCFKKMKMLREGKVPPLVHEVTKFVHWIVSKLGGDLMHPKRLATL